MKFWPKEIDNLLNRLDMEPGSGPDFQLADGEIHVFRLSLASLISSLEETSLVLSPDERERANRFHFEADRQRSVIGRGYLRLLLGRILRLPAKGLHFEYGEFGKPRLTSTQQRGLEFSVSHSGDLVLIAIARGRAIGVDVEMVRADIDVEGIAPRFFSVDEYQSLASLSGSSRYEAFFTYWTRREAYLKARGVGLSASLGQFSSSFLPGWTIVPIAVPSGYQGAAAAEGSDWELRDWSTNLSP